MVRHYWDYQGHTTSLKVRQQEISELTALATALIAFERAYAHTHGERTPVFRLLSMINKEISEHIEAIERGFISGRIVERSDNG